MVIYLEIYLVLRSTCKAFLHTLVKMYAVIFHVSSLHDKDASLHQRYFICHELCCRLCNKYPKIQIHYFFEYDTVKHFTTRSNMKTILKFVLPLSLDSLKTFGYLHSTFNMILLLIEGGTLFWAIHRYAPISVRETRIRSNCSPITFILSKNELNLSN